MKNAELIARLRVIAGKRMADYFNSGHPNSNAITDAADAIEKLQAEVERLNAKIDEHTKLCVKRVAEVTRERNIAQAQLAAAQGQEPACPVCQARPEFSLDRRVGEWSGRCKHCGVDGSPAPTEAEAIRKWIVWHHKKSDSAAPIPQQTAPSVPEGWKLVPIELTEAMEDAAEKAESRHVIADKKRTGGKDPQLSFKAAYAAMIAAAPQPKEPK